MHEYFSCFVSSVFLSKICEAGDWWDTPLQQPCSIWCSCVLRPWLDFGGSCGAQRDTSGVCYRSGARGRQSVSKPREVMHEHTLLKLCSFVKKYVQSNYPMLTYLQIWSREVFLLFCWPFPFSIWFGSTSLPWLPFCNLWGLLCSLLHSPTLWGETGTAGGAWKHRQELWPHHWAQLWDMDSTQEKDISFSCLHIQSGKSFFYVFWSHERYVRSMTSEEQRETPCFCFKIKTCETFCLYICSFLLPIRRSSYPAIPNYAAFRLPWSRSASHLSSLLERPIALPSSPRQ